MKSSRRAPLPIASTRIPSQMTLARRSMRRILVRQGLAPVLPTHPGRSGPIRELFLVAHALQVGEASLEVGLRIAYRLIVDRGADFIETVVGSIPALRSPIS